MTAKKKTMAVTEKTAKKRAALQKKVTKKRIPRNQISKQRQAAKKEAARRKKIPPEDKPLLAQDILFVKSYLKHFDTPLAALEAGFSESVALSAAYSWTSNQEVKPNVYKAVQLGLEQIAKDADIEVGEIVRDLKDLKNICLGRKPQPKSMTIGDKTIDVEIKEVNAAGAKGALELLGKYKKMWGEQKDVNVNIDLSERLLSKLKPTLGPPSKRQKPVIEGEIVKDEPET